MNRNRREKPAGAAAPAASPGTPAVPADVRDPAPDPDTELRELRSSIGNLRAAAEALAMLAIPRPARSARASRPAALLQAVIEEAERASRAVDRFATLVRETGTGRPGGIVVSAPAFAAEIARRAAAELDLVVHLSGKADEGLHVPLAFSDPLLGAFGRLRRDFSVGEVELTARRHADLLALEAAFSAREPEASRLREEHHRVLSGGARGEPSLAEEARAAGGEAWLAIRRGEATFSLRLLLPIPAAP